MISRRGFVVGLSAMTAWAAAGRPAAADDPLKLRDLYNKDLSFSDLAKQLEGSEVTLFGFMAPPLKAEANFYVLTKMPMSVCPFCETEAEWPDDIVLVRTDDTIDVVPFNDPIMTRGVLDLGTETDTETGFVSRVRLLHSDYERAS